jgi:hypothetical protein
MGSIKDRLAARGQHARPTGRVDSNILGIAVLGDEVDCRLPRFAVTFER